MLNAIAFFRHHPIRHMCEEPPFRVLTAAGCRAPEEKGPLQIPRKMMDSTAPYTASSDPPIAQES